MATVAEELRAQGEMRGRAKTVEGLLEAGVSWEMIGRAAGLDETAFRALKEQGCTNSRARWDVIEPHDRMFRSVFSRPAEAAALLRPRLEENIREAVDWSTLTLVEGAFVDDFLRLSAPDLLFKVEPAGEPQPAHLYRQHYILLEFEWSPDISRPRRMIRYCRNIALAAVRKAPEAKLPKVLAVVFYLGREKWAHSSVAEDLFPEPLGPWPKDPCHFGYRVLDETTRPPEQREAGPLGGVALAVLRAATYPADREVEVGRAVDLAGPLYQMNGKRAARLFVMDHLLSEKQRLTEVRAEEYADAKYRAEVVERCLKAGMSWEIIERAMGLDEAAYRALKEQVDAGP